MTALNGHDDVLYCAAFSRDGRRVVTASKDQKAIIWDAATGDKQSVLVGTKID
jgi:WD40 repeat protein